MIQDVYQEIYLIVLCETVEFCKSFVKALQRLNTCLLVSNNFYGKLVALFELPISGSNLRVVPVSFFITDFNLWSGEAVIWI